MGLSNEERTTRTFLGVSKLSRPEIVKNVKKEDELLADLLDQLWPAFLNSYSNDCLWFTGTGAENRYFDHIGLFSAALITNRQDDPLADKSLREFKRWQNEKLNKAKTVKAREKEQRAIYLQNYMEQYVPTLESMMLKNSVFIATVFKIYEICEFLLYTIKRYEDDFAKDNKELASLVAKILGRCYYHFSTDDEARKAWYAYNLVEKIFQGLTYNSLIVQWWADQNIHHNVNPKYHSAEQLHKKYAGLQFKKNELTTEQRILLTLWLSGGSYAFTYEHAALYMKINTHNKNYPDDLVNTQRVKKAINTCIKIKEKRADEEHRSLTRSRFCWLTENSSSSK